MLANLFMHYAFDAWMAREFPAVRFERYCDDVVVHCETQEQAHRVRDAIAARLAECGGLYLHPDKTRIVHCRDGKRRGSPTLRLSFSDLEVRRKALSGCVRRRSAPDTPERSANGVGLGRQPFP